MDNRNRKYYLVSFSIFNQQTRIKDIKTCCRKAKRHSVKKFLLDEYGFYQHLISVRNRDEGLLEYILKKAKKSDSYCKWEKL